VPRAGVQQSHQALQQALAMRPGVRFTVAFCLIITARAIGLSTASSEIRP